jgi:hypothetical protein
MMNEREISLPTISRESSVRSDEPMSSQKFSEHVISGPFSPMKVTNKRRYVLKFYEDLNTLPSCSYCPITKDNIPESECITTYLRGFETRKSVKVGDMCVCGVSGETYVMSYSSFMQNYIRADGSDYLKPPHDAVPNPLQPRIYAEYNGVNMKFIAPWDSEMVLNTGDVVVKEADINKFYRVANQEFFETYNIEFSM